MLVASQNCGYDVTEHAVQDVTLAALYVSSKIHDTLKKPRDILMVGYAVRHPELKSKAVGGELDIDPAVSRPVLPSHPQPHLLCALR